MTKAYDGLDGDVLFSRVEWTFWVIRKTPSASSPSSSVDKTHYLDSCSVMDDIPFSGSCFTMNETSSESPALCESTPTPRFQEEVPLHEPSGARWVNVSIPAVEPYLILVMTLIAVWRFNDDNNIEPVVPIRTLHEPPSSPPSPPPPMQANLPSFKLDGDWVPERFIKSTPVHPPRVRRVKR